MNIKSVALACCPTFLKPAFNQIENSPICYRLVSGSFWSISGAVISQGSKLIAYILISRILGKEGFGEFGIIQSTVGTFGVFAGLGLGMSSTKFIAEFRNTNPAKAGRIMTLNIVIAFLAGGIVAIAFWLLASWLAYRTLAAPHLAETLRLGAFFLFLSTINGTQVGTLSGFEAFRTTAKINFWDGIISFFLIVCGTYLWGLLGTMWGLIIAQTFNLALLHFSLRSEARRADIPFTLDNIWREWNVICQFSLPSFLSGVMISPITWACTALLVNQPGGYGQNGIFTAANQWFIMLLFLPDRINQVNMPMLSNCFSCYDYKGAIKIVLSCLKINITLVLPIVIVFCLASPIIMVSYGSDFENSWPTMVIVLITAIVSCLQRTMTQVVIAYGKIWKMILPNIAWGCVFTIGTYLFIGYGASGLAIARFFAYTLHALLIANIAFRILYRNEEMLDKYKPIK